MNDSRPAPSARPLAAALAVLGLVALLCLALAGPASAKKRAAKAPVQKAETSCVAAGNQFEFGAAAVELRFRKNQIPADDFYVLVPVNDSTGLDSGDRTSVGAGQKRTTVYVPADGRNLTPASTVEVRFGGDVLQRIAVPGGCGEIDATPQTAPEIRATSVDGTNVGVTVVNTTDTADFVVVDLWPVGGNVSTTRSISLAPGEAGTVTFTDVAPGQYYAEAYHASPAEFVTSRSATITVGG